MPKPELIIIPRALEQEKLTNYYGWAVPDVVGLAYASDTRENNGPPPKMSDARWLIHLSSGMAINRSAKNLKKMNEILTAFQKYDPPWTADKDAIYDWLQSLPSDQKAELTWYLTDGADGTDPKLIGVPATDKRVLPILSDVCLTSDITSLFKSWTKQTVLSVGGKTYTVGSCQDTDLILSNSKCLHNYLLACKGIADLTVTGQFLPAPTQKPMGHLSPEREAYALWSRGNQTKHSVALEQAVANGPEKPESAGWPDRYIFTVNFGDGFLTPRNAPRGSMSIAFVLSS